MGFKLNPYNPCVVNKYIGWTQCTICWYVDDLKISHMNPSVVSDVIKEIEEDFGKINLSCGKSHTFRGMNIEFPNSKTIKILMKDYIKECFEAFGKFGEIIGGKTQKSQNVLFLR